MSLSKGSARLRSKLDGLSTNANEEPIIVPLDSQQFPPVGIVDEPANVRVIMPGWENR